jgi:hypothetical protein
VHYCGGSNSAKFEKAALAAGFTKVKTSWGSTNFVLEQPGSAKAIELPAKREKKVKPEKTFTIIKTKTPLGLSKTSTYETTGTLAELTKAFKNTLDTGASYSYEKGNKKINMNPKSVKSLCTQLYNAMNNAAQNGYSGCTFQVKESK